MSNSEKEHEVIEALEGGELCKGLSHKLRYRFMQILVEQPRKEMLLKELIELSSEDRRYHTDEAKALHHLRIMQREGIVEFFRVEVEKKSAVYPGEPKMLTMVRLLRSIKIQVIEY